METLYSRLKTKFPDLTGNLEIKKIGENVVILSGRVCSANKKELSKEIKEIVEDLHPACIVSSNIEFNNFVVTHEEIDNGDKKERVVDEVKILFQGNMLVDCITPRNKFKRVYLDNKNKIDDCIKILKFVAPIILDKNLKVIDGDLRLELAKENGFKKVPVVVIDDNGKRAEFLALALNRTSEFQRWLYREVDDYVDATPQLQPVLEPLGFFGRNLLPVSFFSNSIMEYKIDKFNVKQVGYRQEENLADWASYMKEQQIKKHQEKVSSRKRKLPENPVSLFDLVPSEDDFVQTYEINEELEKTRQKYVDEAARITELRDSVRKKELEEQGRPWQTKNRSTKKYAEDRRKNAIDYVNNSSLSDKEKEVVVKNIDRFSEVFRNLDKVREILNDDFFDELSEGFNEQE